jgi:hypothetical protein
MASDESDNNSDRISIKNIGGRTVTFDNLINIRRRIIRIIEIEKLSKETDLTAFYVSDKDKIMVEDKLKKIRGGIQFLATINQLTVKKRKITIASTNSKSKD